MAQTRKDEERLLTKDENELVAQTHHPALTELSDDDLSSLVPRLRERRDRARDIAQRQSREMRGKSTPQGAQAASDDTGTQAKREALGKAMQRVNKELKRREAKSARKVTISGAQRALKLKRKAGRAGRPDTRSADQGMSDTPADRQPRNKSINEQGSDIALHRSRTAR